jgi:hypothetical protein
MYFFGFSMFFAIFGFFLKIYQNMGQKLGSNTMHEHRNRVIVFGLVTVHGHSNQSGMDYQPSPCGWAESSPIGDSLYFFG